MADTGELSVFNAPIGSDKADRLVKLLELRDGARVLDAGCGTGEFLLRVVAHYQVEGLGVDLDPQCIAAASGAALTRGVDGRCAFRAADVNVALPGAGRFDLAICMGSTHAFGAADAAYPSAIDRLSGAVKPGGLILLGECYWKQPPVPEYAALIGDPVGIYRDHAGNIAFAEERGLAALYAMVSSDDEWDAFEWSHLMKIRRWAEQNPDDPNTGESLGRAKKWMSGYLRWGRSTMGFGVYLFRTAVR